MNLTNQTYTQMTAGNQARAAVGVGEIADCPHHVDDHGGIDRMAGGGRLSVVGHGTRDGARAVRRFSRTRGAGQPPLVGVKIHLLVAGMNDMCSVAREHDALAEQVACHGKGKGMGRDIVEAAFTCQEDHPFIAGT